MRNFGATDAQIADVAQQNRQQWFELWPENMAPMQLFMAMATQWRVSMSGPIGLDYNALPVVEKRLGLKPGKSLFNGVQIIERAVLELLKNGQ